MAAHQLRDDGDIPREDNELLRNTLRWFNEQLSIPRILKDEVHRRAVSWFKSDAKGAIKRMWALAELLKQHGIETGVHKTIDPGYIIYEDGWQVVAKPKKSIKVSW